MDRLAALRAEAADVAERIENLGALDTDNAADVSAREMELKGLVERAAKLNSDISFEEKVAESAKSLRAVADRCTPATEVRKRPWPGSSPSHTVAGSRRSPTTNRDGVTPTRLASGSKATSTATLTRSGGAMTTASSPAPSAKRPTRPAVCLCPRSLVVRW
jgi:plasmid replication initiation protein